MGPQSDLLFQANCDVTQLPCASVFVPYRLLSQTSRNDLAGESGTLGRRCMRGCSDLRDLFTVSLCQESRP
jgi:hypothetical protein